MSLPSQNVPTTKVAGPSDQESGSNLTSGQVQVWIAQKLHPDSPLFHVAGVWWLKGRIEPRHFQNALQTLVNSSDALRTVVHEDQGIPSGVVLEAIPFEMEVLDLSAHKAPREFLQKWVQERVAKPFDLTRRLFDAALLKIAEDDYAFYLCLHHLVSDGWSIALITRLLSDFYGLSMKGVLKEKEPIPQFRDYVRYEEEIQNSEPGRKNVAYWKQKLLGEEEPLVFYGRSIVQQSTNVVRLRCNMGADRSQRIQQAIKRLATGGALADRTALNVFFSMMAAYIYRVTGRDHFTIGVPVHNRRSKQFKETVGFFSEIVPIDVKIRPEDSFASLMEQVRHEIFSALRHGPFSPAAPHNRQSFAVILNMHLPAFVDFCGVPGKAEWLNTGHALETLSLQLYGFNPSEEMAIEFDFNRDLFVEDLPARGLQHFLSVVDAFLENESMPLGKINLLPDSERKQVLEDWNATASKFPDQCVHQWFEEQVRRAPDDLAVVDGERRLTYRELNERAIQCAAVLQRRGVKPGAFVGVCTERSIDTIVGVVGTLKAGAAYVPLDPAYPADRLAFMLEDSDAPVLLTQRRLVSSLPVHESRVVCMDEPFEGAEGYTPPAVTPDNPAYVIYTSGSTGKPKGVVMEHRPLVNLLKWQLFDSGLPSKARTLQFSSLSFDVSFQEIFSTLCGGGTLVLIKEELRLDAMGLLTFLREQRIERLFLPFVALQNLAEASRESATVPDSLKQIITAGEQLQITPGLIHLMNSLRGCVLQNQYGPTESHVVTAYSLQGSTETWPPLPPIGRPINNTQIYLLDPSMQPVPVGISGELYIGGVCLAREYHRRPDLTAEKFVPNPFDPHGKSRLYRTGDLARYLSDGQIEFLGRIDHQVKIRGFRIELGEIESLLSQYEDVKDVVVMARDDQGGVKRLVGYVVPKPGKTIEVGSLRGFLKGQCPDYMVPAAFVVMQAFPLTPSGKVDRKSLPSPDRSSFDTGMAHVPPRNETEQKLVEIWKEVLALPKVGVRDNFFEIGGHSLMAVKMFSKIKASFHNHLPLTAIFNAPTIEGLAQLLDSKDGGSSTWSNLVPIQTEGSGTPIFWVHTLGGGGGGGLFRYKKLVELIGADRPSYGIQAPQEPFGVLEDMAAHYIQWIKSFQPKGPYHLAGYCFGGNVAYEMARQLREQGDEVAFLGLLDAGAFPPTARPSYENKFRMIWDFSVNFYHWFGALIRQKPSQHWLRIKRRWNAIKKRRQTPLLNGETKEDLSALLELEEVVDVAQYPEEYRKYAATHWHAFLNYRPKPYEGVLDVYRVQQHGLLEFEPTLGWQFLARGKLNIHVIPGSHETLFDDPYVAQLAAQVRVALKEPAKG